MTDWQELPAGPELRQIIAERLGWHIRKIWVDSHGIDYDYLVYNNDDHLMYQREIASGEALGEATITKQVWQAAMKDPDCPRWDEDVAEARDLAYGLDYHIQPTVAGFTAWVKSPEYVGQAHTEALALVRAWLATPDSADRSL